MSVHLIQLKLVTYNVSGVPDMIESAKKAEKSKESKVAEKAKEILDSANHQNEIFGDLSSRFMRLLLNEVSPDILCLQEMSKKALLEKYEHAKIAEILKAFHYDLLVENDTAVAYKTDIFKLIKNGSKGDPSAPAYYADLQLKNYNYVIRAVSDHLSFSLGVGDKNLILNLDAINVPLKKQKIKSFFSENKQQPGLIFYGLDANATRKVLDDTKKNEEWQPERLEIFSTLGYQTDMTDEAPTLEFKEIKQKIDHIFLKVLRGKMISLKHDIISGINDAEMLGENKKQFPASDHLPVIYTLELDLV